MPAEIEFRDALPKTMIGKLSKKELKAEEAARTKPKQMSARPPQERAKSASASACR